MRTSVVNFVRLIPSLTHDEQQLVKISFDAISDYQKVRELIEANQEEERRCPHCDSNHIYRHGQSNGLQRYRCIDCRKTYNSLTKTPLAHLRKKELWLKHLELMMSSTVLRDVSKQLAISLPTAFQWRHRFSAWLEQNNTNHLEGIIEMDETYFKKSKKGCKELGRPAHKRGGAAGKRGLSKEQVCVFTARDRSLHSVESIAGVGPASKAWLLTHITDLIAHDSVLVADGLSSYQALARESELSLVVVKNKKGKRVQGAYHIQHVNAYHSRLKSWVNGHFRGVSTKYLRHYLWWRHELESNEIQNPIDLFKVVIQRIPQLS